MTVRVERDVAIPAAAGVELRADVYRADEETPGPVLLQYTAYDKENWLSVFGPFSPFRAVERGFAVVVADALGRHASGGQEPFRPFLNDADGAVACLDWIVRQPWSNGHVGMYGPSNSGVPVLQALRRGHRALRSIVAHFTTSEFEQGWVYRGGAFSYGFNAWWSLVNLAPDLMRRAAREGIDTGPAWAEWNELFASPDELFSRPVDRALGAVQPFVPHYDEWVANPPESDYWRSTSMNGRWSDVDIPALHVAGWFNVHLDGNLEMFQQARRHAPAADRHHLIVGPWTQWMPALGEACGPEARFPNALIDMAGLQLDWFAETMSGEAPAPRERVRAFVMGVEEWMAFGDWPPPEGGPVEWFLGSRSAAGSTSGSLDTEPTDQAVVHDFVHDPSDPVPTVGGATMLPMFTVSAGPRDQRLVEERADVLVFSTDVLDQPVTVVGPVEARLFVSCDEESTDITAKLVDVHPDGRAVALCDGIVRTTPDILNLIEAQEIVVDLIATGNRFAAGHQIRLEVSASNFPKFDLHSRRGDDGLPVARTTPWTVRIHSGAATPSRLVLHVIPS